MRVLPDLMKRFMSQTLVPLIAHVDTQDLLVVGKMVEDRKVRPVIDRTYAFAETRMALAHVFEGRAQGKIVIRI